MNKEKTIDDFYDWADFLLKSIIKVCRTKDEKDLECFYDIVNQIEYHLKEGYAKKNFRTVKAALNELEMWALELDPIDIKQINDLVYEKYGRFVGEETIFKKVASIIKRGRIRNIEEYRTLLDVLDIYSDDIAKKDITNSITTIIYEYEKTMSGR